MDWLRVYCFAVVSLSCAGYGWLLWHHVRAWRCDRCGNRRARYIHTPTGKMHCLGCATYVQESLEDWAERRCREAFIREVGGQMGIRYTGLETWEFKRLQAEVKRLIGLIEDAKQNFRKIS